MLGASLRFFSEGLTTLYRSNHDTIHRNMRVTCDNTEIAAKATEARSSGILYFYCAIDHVRGLSHLINQAEPCSYASAAPTRAALEACSRSMWLLEQDVLAHDLAHRALRLQCASYALTRQWLQSAKERDDERSIALARIAERLGLKLCRPPCATDLIKMYLDMEQEYRCFSAVCHGDHRVLVHFGLDVPAAVKTDVQGIMLVQAGYSPALLSFLSMTGFTALLKCARNFWGALGLDRSALTLLELETKKRGDFDRLAGSIPRH